MFNFSAVPNRVSSPCWPRSKFTADLNKNYHKNRDRNYKPLRHCNGVNLALSCLRRHRPALSELRLAKPQSTSIGTYPTRIYECPCKTSALTNHGANRPPLTAGEKSQAKLLPIKFGQ
ncbi:MAG: hypothetical protein GY820_31935 [Gammaproteobacteria bacterium]|nr:hypothetical protein [Gammaproteobacteria bacterium]